MYSLIVILPKTPVRERISLPCELQISDQKLDFGGEKIGIMHDLIIMNGKLISMRLCLHFK